MEEFNGLIVLMGWKIGEFKIDPDEEKATTETENQIGELESIALIEEDNKPKRKKIIFLILERNRPERPMTVNKGRTFSKPRLRLNALMIRCCKLPPVEIAARYGVKLW